MVDHCLLASSFSAFMVMQPALSEIYQKIMHTWTREAGHRSMSAQLTWVGQHHRTIAERISSYRNVNTRKLHHQALAAVMRCLERPMLARKYASIVGDLKKRSMQAESCQTLTASERQKWIPLCEIKRKVEALAQHVRSHPLDIRANFQHLLLALYTMQPPIRREYSDMRIVKKALQASEGNYLLCSAPGAYTVVLNRDKVSKQAGPARFKLSRALGTVIEQSLQHYPRAYLLSLIRTPSKPLGGQRFDKLLADIWPERKVTVNVLRSAYVTAFYEQHPNISAKDGLAALMRHSRSTAETFYYKPMICRKPGRGRTETHMLDASTAGSAVPQLKPTRHL